MKPLNKLPMSYDYYRLMKILHIQISCHRNEKFCYRHDRHHHPTIMSLVKHEQKFDVKLSNLHLDWMNNKIYYSTFSYVRNEYRIATIIYPTSGCDLRELKLDEIILHKLNPKIDIDYLLGPMYSDYVI